MSHRVSYWDLEFDRAPLPALSSLGRPYTKWVKVGMPRIPPEIINCVFYLYRTKEDAEAGRNPGGTGFIVISEGTFNEFYPGQFFGVTNWHVACDGGYSVIRLTTSNGGTEIIELNPDQWHFLPRKYDIAVVPLAFSSRRDVSTVSTRIFAAEAHPDFRSEISIGDDTFMIGLFIDHNGGAVNVPSARFGNVSMLPNKKATIEQPTGYHGESFVVDMHSRAGFSGSPVFAYRTFGNDLTQVFGHDFDEIELDDAQVEGTYGNRIRGRRGRIRTHNMFKLLGIHWGQFPEKWELKDKSVLQEARRKHLLVEGGYVEGLSGMTCVIPAWQIYEVLQMPELKKLREKRAEHSESVKPKPEAQATDENPTHREDFTSLLNAAARKQPQGG